NVSKRNMKKTKKQAACLAAAAAAVAGLAIAPSARADIKFNEMFLDAPGTNSVQDFIELRSTTGGVESLNNLTVIFLEGDAGGTPGGNGNIDAAPVSLAGQSTGTNGLFLRDSMASGLPSPAPDAATVEQKGGWSH